MNRQALFDNWVMYYLTLPEDEVLMAIVERTKVIEGRMVALARFSGRIYKGMRKRALEAALGMSLGVHKQLLWRLTSYPRGGNLKGGGGVQLEELRPRSGYNIGSKED